MNDTTMRVIASSVYGDLSIEPSVVLIESVIKHYNRLAWNTGPAPGYTDVLVRTVIGYYIASFVGQPGKWICQDGVELNCPVLEWRSIC